MLRVPEEIQLQDLGQAAAIAAAIASVINTGLSLYGSMQTSKIQEELAEKQAQFQLLLEQQRSNQAAAAAIEEQARLERIKLASALPPEQRALYLTPEEEAMVRAQEALRSKSEEGDGLSPIALAAIIGGGVLVLGFGAILLLR